MYATTTNVQNMKINISTPLIQWYKIYSTLGAAAAINVYNIYDAFSIFYNIFDNASNRKITHYARNKSSEFCSNGKAKLINNVV